MSSESQHERKQKTTKSRRETTVQGTNDSSIVSKCSMAAMGYFQDEFLQSFVSKVTRRAPLIHRGYYIRAETLNHLLKTFISSHAGTKQIISLGAGFDSAYFRLKSQSLLADVVFYEVDFPDVVKRKCALIKSQPVLNDLVGTQLVTDTQKSPLVEMSSADYKLLGVDLTQLTTLEAVLKLCAVDFDTPTLLLSECVLTYMTRRCSSSVVQWAGETFSNAVFILYEQINPSDAFGLFMKNHFCNVGSPLRCIDSFPTLLSQKERFQSLGWPESEGLDMNQFYCQLVAQEEKDRIEHLEPFDEYEEWHLKCAHYMVLCGYRGNCHRLLPDQHEKIDMSEGIVSKQNPVTSQACLAIATPTSTSPLRRFGHGSAICGEHSVLTVGGFGDQNGKHMRVTDMTLTDLVSKETTFIKSEVNNKEIEVSRMHATLSALQDGSLLLIGGRLSPMRLCTQMVCIQVKCEECNFATQAVNAGLSKTDPNQRLTTCYCENKRFTAEETLSNTNSEKSNLLLESEVFDKSKHSEKPLSSSTVENIGTDINKSDFDSRIPEYSIKVVDYEIEGDINNSYTGKSNGKNGAICGATVTEDQQAVPSSAQTAYVSKDTGFSVDCSVILQQGEAPCPRWRHSAVVCQTSYGESVVVFGGRTQDTLALDDCFLYTPHNRTWRQLTTTGERPSPRQSHTASCWRGHMIIAGGLGNGTEPLDSVHMLDLESVHWTVLTCNVLPRYSHTAHVIQDCLVLIGGVSVSHSPPGVAVISLQTGACSEIPLPIQTKDSLVMLHRHTSVVMDNQQVVVLGGGGNCFSFGTHLNSSPIVLDLSEAVRMMSCDS